MEMTARRAAGRLREFAKPSRATTVARFFKTGPGEYGHGDRFLGVRVPEIRLVVREFELLPDSQIKSLACSPWHEERMLGFLIWVRQFQRAKSEPVRQAEIVRLYLTHRRHLNNWDLVDVTAPQLLGVYLAERSRSVLRRFARSKKLWERRIAIVTTQEFIRRLDFKDTLRIAEMFLGDSEDLIHKATGWMLREMGKRDVKPLLAFLDRHAARMPRTMLRYAIERLSVTQKKKYMAMGPQKQ